MPTCSSAHSRIKFLRSGWPEAGMHGHMTPCDSQAVESSAHHGARLQVPYLAMALAQEMRRPVAKLLRRL